MKAGARVLRYETPDGRLVEVHGYQPRLTEYERACHNFDAPWHADTMVVRSGIDGFSVRALQDELR